MYYQRDGSVQLDLTQVVPHFRFLFLQAVTNVGFFGVAPVARKKENKAV